MADKTQHAREDSCTTSRIAYDGGVVNLATQEIWVLCTSRACTHDSCKGMFAADIAAGTEGYETEKVKARRIRSVSDLKKHLGDRKAHELSCIVAPRGTYSSERPAPSLFRRGRLPEGVSRGQTSLKQASDVTSFPLRGRARAYQTELLKSLETFPGETPESNNRRMSLMGDRVARLIRKNGVDAVRRALPTATRSSLALSARVADFTLVEERNAYRVAGHKAAAADRDSKSALAQPRKATTESVPSSELFALAPLKGAPSAGRLTVQIEPGFGEHFMYRFMDRGLGSFNTTTVQEYRSGTRSFTKADMASAALAVTTLLDNGVFTHSVDPSRRKDKEYRTDGVVTDKQKAAATKWNPAIATRCEVRTPHPTDPNSDLVFILEVGSRDASSRPAQEKAFTRHYVKPVTCINIPKDTQTRENKSYGDAKIDEVTQGFLEASIRSRL